MFSRTILLSSLVLLSFLVIPTMAQADRIDLPLLVVDGETGLPMPSVDVRIVGQQQRFRSDPLGWVSLQLEPAQTVRIILRTEGYQRMTLTRVRADRLEHYLVAEMKLHVADRNERLLRGPDGRMTYKSLAPQPLLAPSPTIAVPTTVKVRLTKENNKIIELDLEEYVRGVLPREIGTSAPLEAIKAQAIAARSYAINYLKSHESICDTAACQVWGSKHYDKTDLAVEQTKGQVAIYNGKIINAVFSAQCGGHTIDGNQPQGGTCGAWSNTAYLKGVPCWENKSDKCDKVCTVTRGRTINGKLYCGLVGTNPDPDLCYDIWGHQRGLCQRGSMSMARCGKNYVEIIKHYYTGVEIANMPPSETDGATLASETPPSSPIYPGQSFTVSWTMKNSGETTWSKGDSYVWAHVEGDNFGKPGYFTLNDSETIAPDAERVWTLTLTAPPAPGTYRGYWQMRRGGTVFGDKVWVDLVVVADPSKPDVVYPTPDVNQGGDPDTNHGGTPTDDTTGGGTQADTTTNSGGSSGCHVTAAPHHPYDLLPYFALLLLFGLLAAGLRKRKKRR